MFEMAVIASAMKQSVCLWAEAFKLICIIPKDCFTAFAMTKLIEFQKALKTKLFGFLPVEF